ncbi:MAG: adenosylcobinamide-GDP ribazoletransferase [Rhodobacteraceae bacterium]|nr:adenosylcobinamide-GDP ribazoletransferase [Paracoccaceae bacterium]
MPDHDMPLATPGDVAEAIGLLTRLPVPFPARPRGAAAAWAYPLAGLAVGLLAALTAWLGSGLPPGFTAGLALTALIVATGALHEDGLADSTDGFWGGTTRERRLEIMKDSRIGSYGVLALILSLGLRWVALAAIADESTTGLMLALIAAAILSRAPMVALMHLLPQARSGGLSASVGRPDRPATLLALGLAAAAGCGLVGSTIVPLAIVLTFTSLSVAAIAKRKIGGQTGDVLGGAQQISEVVILVALAA